MIQPAPSGGPRFELIERTIANVRLGAAFGAYALIALGGVDARSYASIGFAVVTAAVVYSLAMATKRYRLKPEASTALDMGFSLGIIACTGAGRSIAVGYLFLVLGASALRFQPATARVIAAIGSTATAIVVLATPLPDIPLALRIELAVGWAGSLLLTSILVGLLANFELQDRAELLLERERATSLRAQVAARRRTLRMVAHDLTAPLAAVEGIAGALRDGSVELSEADHQEVLEILADHATHLQSFASSLRDVANAGDATKLQRPAPVRLELDTFLETVCRSHTFGPERTVEVDVRTQLPVITTDPDKLRRVLVNLIENAIRHSPASSSVVLDASADEGSVSLRVIDAGNGVAEEELGQIFLPEWQGADEAGESGLGLWIVAELVSELGGTVEASNVDDGGLSVVVVIPVVAPDAARSQ